jgi:hypothetical protein
MDSKIIFLEEQAVWARRLGAAVAAISMRAWVGFSTDGHRPTLQFAFQMILLSMILPFFRQFTEYLHDMN